MGRLRYRFRQGGQMVLDRRGGGEGRLVLVLSCLLSKRIVLIGVLSMLFYTVC